MQNCKLFIIIPQYGSKEHFSLEKQAFFWDGSCLKSKSTDPIRYWMKGSRDVDGLFEQDRDCTNKHAGLPIAMQLTALFLFCCLVDITEFVQYQLGNSQLAGHGQYMKAFVITPTPITFSLVGTTARHTLTPGTTQMFPANSLLKYEVVNFNGLLQFSVLASWKFTDRAFRVEKVWHEIPTITFDKNSNFLNGQW